MLTSFPLLGGEIILNCKYTDSHRNYPAPEPYVINENGHKFTFEDRCDQINYYNGLKNRRENGRFFLMKVFAISQKRHQFTSTKKNNMSA